MSKITFCPPKKLVLLSVLSLLLLTPALASAQLPPPDPSTTPPTTTTPAASPGPFALSTGRTPFGSQGQLVISSELSLSLIKIDGGETTFSIQPAADYFIVPNISVGGAVGLSISSGDPGVTVFHFAARGGYNLVLQDRVTFWPILGLDVQRFSSGSASSTATALVLFAPFLFHPVDHLFIGVGPAIAIKLSDAGYTFYGLQSTVGGWL